MGAGGQSRGTDQQDVDSHEFRYEEMSRPVINKNLTVPRVDRMLNQSPIGLDQRTIRRLRDSSADSLDRVSAVSESRQSCRDSPEHLHGIKTPKFTGEGSIEDFFLKFEDMSSLLSWRGESLTKRLRLSMEGAALRVVRNMSVTSTYDEMKEKLMSKYGAESRRVQYEAQLNRRTQAVGETFQQLAEDIDNLVSLSQPELEGKAREKVTIRHFLHAINPDLSIRIKCQNPETLDQAVLKCTQMEAWEQEREDIRKTRGLTNETTSTPKTSSYKDDVESEKIELEKLTARIKNMETKFKQSNNDQQRNTSQPPQKNYQTNNNNQAEEP